MTKKPFYELDPRHTDPTRVRHEREKAQALKASGWWKQIINQGRCHYCGNKFLPRELTMDHIVPIARGGTSTRGNVVPACKPCNINKKLDTPVDDLFRQLDAERAGGAPKGNPGDPGDYGDGTGEEF